MQQTETVRDSVRVVEVGALIVRVEDLEIAEPDRAQGVDVGLGHLAGSQRHLVDVAGDRRVDPLERVVVASVEGA